MVVRTGDILSPARHKDAIATRNWGILRHDPKDEAGTTDTNGRSFYESPEIGGAMEPNVFSKFEKLRFEIDLGFLEYVPGEKFTRGVPVSNHAGIYRNAYIIARPWLHVENKLLPEEEPAITEYIQGSNIIGWFSNIMARSPYVRHLEVFLYMAVSHILRANGEWSSEDVGQLFREGE